MGTNESHFPDGCRARDRSGVRARGPWFFVGLFQHGGATPVALWAEVEPVSDSNAGKGGLGAVPINIITRIKHHHRAVLGESTR